MPEIGQSVVGLFGQDIFDVFDYSNQLFSYYIKFAAVSRRIRAIPERSRPIR